MIRILVVDDDEDFRQTVCDMLADSDFKTFSVDSGAQSFAVLRHQAVDIVLTDIVIRMRMAWRLFVEYEK